MPEEEKREITDVMEFPVVARAVSRTRGSKMEGAVDKLREHMQLALPNAKARGRTGRAARDTLKRCEEAFRRLVYGGEPIIAACREAGVPMKAIGVGGEAKPLTEA